MKLLFAISGKRLPASRIRVLAFVPHLRKLGHSCVVKASFPAKYDYFSLIGFRPSQWLKRIVRRWHLLTARLRASDIFFLERELFDSNDGTLEAKFRQVVPRFVLDIDDGVFLRYPEKIEQLARMSDLIIAGNRFLKEYLSPFNSNIVVIPTCVDTDVFAPKSSTGPTSGRCIIGWIGTTLNLNYLSVIAPALRSLASRVDFELKLIAGDSSPLANIDLAGVNVRFEKWDESTEADQLRECDIGLMPLDANDDWNKYKCAFKLLLYMSIGIPGVASPVGVNADIVRHGENGFLCNRLDEWEETLLRLIQDPELRKSIGLAARQTVVSEFSIHANFPRLVECLQTVIDQPSIRSSARSSAHPAR